MGIIGTRPADSGVMKNRRRTTTKAKRPSAPKASGGRNPSSTNANANALGEAIDAIKTAKSCIDGGSIK